MRVRGKDQEKKKDVNGCMNGCMNGQMKWHDG